MYNIYIYIVGIFVSEGVSFAYRYINHIIYFMRTGIVHESRPCTTAYAPNTNRHNYGVPYKVQPAQHPH